MAEGVTITVKWSGSEYKVADLDPDDTVLVLKHRLQELTGVLVSRQKLLGLKLNGKPAPDEAILSSIKINPSAKIMMMGTKEADIEEASKVPEDLPEVVNDLDDIEEEIAIENNEIYLNKISRRIRDYKVEILNEPRAGKKLLVLDIDYTLFDHRSSAETGIELMRPHLHEFLTEAYNNYDIVIWSATNMKWIVAKMKELGVDSNPYYKICFYMCSLAMISVVLENRGVVDVKPLGVIWGKYPQWSAKNTIMFDDIRRNFLMNPQSGLKIRPFKSAHMNRANDKELLGLKDYLTAIAELDDFTKLNHRKWERETVSDTGDETRQK